MHRGLPSKYEPEQMLLIFADKQVDIQCDMTICLRFVDIKWNINKNVYHWYKSLYVKYFCRHSLNCDKSCLSFFHFVFSPHSFMLFSPNLLNNHLYSFFFSSIFFFFTIFFSFYPLPFHLLRYDHNLTELEINLEQFFLNTPLCIRPRRFSKPVSCFLSR